MYNQLNLNWQILMFENWVFIKIMWNQQKSDIRIMIYQTHFNVRLQNSFSILLIASVKMKTVIL